MLRICSAVVFLIHKQDRNGLSLCARLAISIVSKNVQHHRSDLLGPKLDGSCSLARTCDGSNQQSSYDGSSLHGWR